MSRSISAAALLERITSGDAPAIIDVRSAREFVDGHVPGAVNVPFLRVSKHVEAIPADRDAELVVYCGHGPRAIIAARSLRKHGFTHITYLEGHFSKWRSAGLREERL
jgi:rhodanese-related sulfurtransferase